MFFMSAPRSPQLRRAASQAIVDGKRTLRQALGHTILLEAAARAKAAQKLADAEMMYRWDFNFH